MLTNESLRLSDAQLNEYNRWAERMAAAAFDADAGVSHSIVIAFSFSPFGRHVEAVVAGSGKTLILED